MIPQNQQNPIKMSFSHQLVVSGTSENIRKFLVSIASGCAPELSKELNPYSEEEQIIDKGTSIEFNFESDEFNFEIFKKSRKGVEGLTYEYVLFNRNTFNFKYTDSHGQKFIIDGFEDMKKAAMLLNKNNTKLVQLTTPLPKEPREITFTLNNKSPFKAHQYAPLHNCYQIAENNIIIEDIASFVEPTKYIVKGKVTGTGQLIPINDFDKEWCKERGILLELSM